MRSSRAILLNYTWKVRLQGGGDFFKVIQKNGGGVKTTSPSPEFQAKAAFSNRYSCFKLLIQQKVTEAATLTYAQKVTMSINLPARNGKWKNSEHWENKCQINLSLALHFCRKPESNIAQNTKLSNLTWKLWLLTFSVFSSFHNLRYFSLSLFFK